MIVSDDKSIDCIGRLEEQNFAKFCFKISLQALNRLWKLPKWVILDNGIATPEEYLIWSWIDTVKGHSRYLIHNWVNQWYKIKSNLPLEVMCLLILMNVHKKDVKRLLPDDIQGELEQLSTINPQVIQYHHMFCHSIEESEEDSSNKRIKIECITYSKFDTISMYQIATNKVDDHL
jgi:hypothetical protein